ncbi:MAG: hypothetical protein EOP37_18695 [Rubrivivax sp.]|nr:MAG: hypothetical protein EOP37_18695 [Rubrivivax sp.]
MPIKSHDLLLLATELASSPVEVRQRAAIGRAYDASYHRCIDWERKLPRKARAVELKGSHESLIARLRHPDPACSADIAACSREIGDELEIQRRNRAHADYKVKAWVSRHMLDEQLELAAKVLDLCDRSERAIRGHSRRRAKR